MDRERACTRRCGGSPRRAAPRRRRAARPARRTRPAGRRRRGLAAHGVTPFATSSWSIAAGRAAGGRSAGVPRACRDTSSRISKTEIIGRKRMNRNSRKRNSPIEPTYSPPVPDRRVEHAPTTTGQEVAVQAGHDDDEPLQPHADVDDDRDRRTAARMLSRTRWNQSSCGDERRCTGSAPSSTSQYGPVHAVLEHGDLVDVAAVERHEDFHAGSRRRRSGRSRA